VPDAVTTAVKPAYFVLQIVNLPITWFVLLQVKCINCNINIVFLKYILGELILNLQHKGKKAKYTVSMIRKVIGVFTTGGILVHILRQMNPLPTGT
jgi:hypothetical protein